MDISSNLLNDLQILVSLIIIVTAVIVVILKYRRSLSYHKAYAFIISGLILNAAVELPGRSLNGIDGIVIVLNLVVIVSGLAAFSVVLWRAASKCSQGGTTRD